MRWRRQPQRGLEPTNLPITNRLRYRCATGARQVCAVAVATPRKHKEGLVTGFTGISLIFNSSRTPERGQYAQGVVF